MKPDAIAELALGASLRAYSFDRYKTKTKEGEEKRDATKVTFAGQAVLGVRDIRWTLSAGVTPAFSTIDVHSSQGEAFAALVGHSGDLVIATEEGEERRVRDLYVVGETASIQPFVRTFTIADKRWKWARKHVRRTYNEPRRISSWRPNGSTLPDELPKLTRMPCGRRQSSD